MAAISGSGSVSLIYGHKDSYADRKKDSYSRSVADNYSSSSNALTSSYGHSSGVDSRFATDQISSGTYGRALTTDSSRYDQYYPQTQSYSSSSQQPSVQHQSGSAWGTTAAVYNDNTGSAWANRQPLPGSGL